MTRARPAARGDDALDRRVGARRSGPSSSPCSRSSGAARRSRSTARACTGSAPRSRGRCRARCCRPLLPEIAGLETAALYRAAGEGTDVGGDFYDLFSVAEDEWIAVIGDVCGKGAEAAAVTALARYTIRTAAVRRRSPAAILRWLNDAMLPAGLSAGASARSPACTWTRRGRGHPRHGGLRRASAGAAAARGRRGGGGRARPGTLLGLVDDPALEDERAELAPGDALVLYTDGITEARAPERVLERRGPARGAARRPGRLGPADRRATRGARGRARRARRRATTSPSSRCARGASAG